MEKGVVSMKQTNRNHKSRSPHTIFKKGNKLKIFFSDKHPNNGNLEVRAIVDREIVVARSLNTGRYSLETLTYLQLLKREGILKKGR